MGGSVGGGATGGAWSGGAGSWTNANNPNTATYTAGASESGSITLTLTTSGGSCGTTTATKTITVNQNPTATAGAALAARCQGLISAAMGGSVGGGATGGTWSGGAGSWTNATNPSTATYTAGASESGSITLSLTTSGGSCGTTTATKTITVNQNPTATAGAALAARCQGLISAAMGGSVGGGATGGTWSGGAGSWTNATNPSTATYTAGVSESGSITLTLTTSGGSCGTTTATKTITVNPNPTATAGAALSAICQSGTSAAMGGSFGGGATGGTWSGGAGSWTNATNPSTATYTAGASESSNITLTLTTNGGSCGTATATKTITINQNPTVNAGGALSAICQSGTSAAMGGSFGGGATSGTWSGGAGSWTNATNPSTATYTAGASESGSITLTFTTSGGSCGTTTATKTITINQNPTVNAGGALSAICQGGTSSALSGSVGGGATGGTWSDGGAGGIFNPNATTLNATYTAAVNATSTVTLTLTTNGGLCGTINDSKNVTVNPIAVIGNFTATICNGSLFTVNPTGSIPTGTTYTWAPPIYSLPTLSGGSAQSGQGNVSQLLTNSGTTIETATYTVTPISTGACAGATFTVTVTVYPTLLAPSVTTVNTTGPTSINLQWSAASLASTYFVQISTSPTFANCTPNCDINNFSTSALTANQGGLLSTGIYYYRVASVNAVCGASAYSDITAFVTQSLTWNGLTNSDWNIATNWAPALVPTVNLDAKIVPQPFSPKIFIGNNGNVKNLEFEPNTTLDIASGQFLNVKGNWTAANAGNTITGLGTVVFNGTVPQTLFGNSTFSNITIDNATGVSISTNGITGTQTVNRIVRLSSGVFTTNNKLLLTSNLVTTGMISGTGTGSITGNVSSQRYMPGPQGYRYVSSPIADVSGQTTSDFDIPIVGTAGFAWDPLQAIPSPFPNCWYYNETVDNYYPQYGWVAAGNTPIVRARGYALITPGGHVATLVGQVNTGSLNSVDNLTRTGTANGAGFNLLGNPYPSPISWNSFRNDPANTGILSNVVKRFASTGSYYGQYVDFNGTVAVPAGSGGDGIALGQAFFVTKLGTTPATVSFNNAMRVDNASTTFFEAEPEVNNLLRMQLIGGAGADELAVYFDQSATNGYDENLDAIKFLSEVAGIPNIYTNIDSLKLSINALQDFSQDMVVPMGIVAKTNGNYQVNVLDMTSFAPGSILYLEDRLLDTWTNLNTVNQYNVTLPIGEHNGRFFIHFRPAVNVAITNETCQQTDGAVSITNPSVEQQWTSTLLNLAGQVVAQSTNGNVTFNGLNDGNYTLRLEDANGYTVEQPISIEAGQVVEAAIAPLSSNYFYTTDLIEASVEQVTSGMIYEWYINGVLQGTGPEISLNITQAGLYNLVLRMSGTGCIFETSTNFSVTQETTVGIESVTENGFGVYPNPTNEILNIQKSEKGSALIEVHDMLGKIVMRKTFTGNTTQINTKWLQDGVYMVVMHQANVSKTLRVVVVH